MRNIKIINLQKQLLDTILSVPGTYSFQKNESDVSMISIKKYETKWVINTKIKVYSDTNIWAVSRQVQLSLLYKFEKITKVKNVTVNVIVIDLYDENN